MCIFHKWTDWFRTEGGYQDCYFGTVLRETPLMEGWGRYCRRCHKEEFDAD